MSNGARDTSCRGDLDKSYYTNVSLEREREREREGFISAIEHLRISLLEAALSRASMTSKEAQTSLEAHFQNELINEGIKRYTPALPDTSTRLPHVGT